MHSVSVLVSSLSPYSTRDPLVIGKQRMVENVRVVIYSWHWNIERRWYSCIVYILPLSHVFPSSWRTRCWMDGVATPQAEPPCRGGRSPMWRTKTAASVGGVVFVSGRFCVVFFWSVDFWILYWFIVFCLEYKDDKIIGKLYVSRATDWWNVTGVLWLF